MVGFLLMSHGDLSEGVISAANCILDHQVKSEALTLGIDDDIGTFEASLDEKLDKLDDGSGVLVMVDLLGGTPCNKASMALRGRNVELVTGLSFPMYIAACEARAEGKDLQAIKDDCVKFGKDGIISMRDYYRSKGLNI